MGYGVAIRYKFFLPSDPEEINKYQLNLFEEEFILIYHLKQGLPDFSEMPIFERKWLIDRFVEQKKKEEEHAKGNAHGTRSIGAGNRRVV